MKIFQNTMKIFSYENGIVKPLHICYIIIENDFVKGVLI